jgi:hypothetical protein
MPNGKSTCRECGEPLTEWEPWSSLEWELGESHSDFDDDEAEVAICEKCGLLYIALFHRGKWWATRYARRSDG